MPESKRKQPRNFGKTNKTLSLSDDGQSSSEIIAEIMSPDSPKQSENQHSVKFTASEAVFLEDKSLTIAEIAEKYKMTHSGVTN